MREFDKLCRAAERSLFCCGCVFRKAACPRNRQSPLRGGFETKGRPGRGATKSSVIFKHAEEMGRVAVRWRAVSCAQPPPPLKRFLTRRLLPGSGFPFGAGNPPGGRRAEGEHSPTAQPVHAHENIAVRASSHWCAFVNDCHHGGVFWRHHNASPPRGRDDPSPPPKPGRGGRCWNP